MVAKVYKDQKFWISGKKKSDFPVLTFSLCCPLKKGANTNKECPLLVSCSSLAFRFGSIVKDLNYFQTFFLLYKIKVYSQLFKNAVFKLVS